MKIEQILFSSAAFAIMAGTATLADRPQVVGPLPGYKCMVLNLTEQQSMDPNTRIPVFDRPAADGHQVGIAAGIVAVKDPSHIVDGFTEALFPTGATVWIKSDVLRPYHSVSDPTARCVPSKMSNGRSGFDFPRSP